MLNCKKKIALGPDPKATVSMYSELGLIPSPRIKAHESGELPPEISYPIDTIKKIIEIKDLKKKGLRLEEIRDSYALDYVKDAIQDIMTSDDDNKIKEMAVLLFEQDDKLSGVLEAPILKVIETKNPKELNKLLSLFATQSLFSMNDANALLEKYNVNDAKRSLFKSIFYLSVICLRLARNNKDKALEDLAFEIYNKMVLLPIERASKKFKRNLKIL
ncbi:hypothetical protein CM15mP43_12070 [bacterium]|nr:MAG: hypothetical protein CM15mP43_12070 [bacterium]